MQDWEKRNMVVCYWTRVGVRKKRRNDEWEKKREMAVSYWARVGLLGKKKK